MKLAAADVIVWLIIAAIVGIAKLWGKLAVPTDETDQPEAPPRPTRSLPVRRAVPRRVPPRIEPAAQAVPEELHRLLGQLTHATPAPKAMPAEPPIPAPPPTPAAPATPVATTSRRFSRGARWAAALRDKQNVRNIVISAEIIGRPKSAID